MTTSPHPGRTLFVNLPVADPARSTEFFVRLGFTVDPAFTDADAACLVIGEHARVMVLSHAKFAEFSPLPVADATTHALGLYCFTVSSPEEVDAVCEAALAGGAVEVDGLEDFGFMRTRSFRDLDGHGWQVLWMDPSASVPA